MSADDVNGVRERLRAALGAAQSDATKVSRAIGRGKDYVRDFLDGRKRSMSAADLAAVEKDLGLPVGFLLHGDAAASPAAPPLTAQPEPNASAPEPMRYPRRTLPVYGEGVGGDDGRFVMNGQTLDHVLCPPSLEAVAKAYAVYVRGESMLDRFQPGEVVHVDPHQPVVKGDDVVVQLHEGEGEPPSGFIKRFVSMNGRELVLQQLRPPEGQDEMLRFPRSRVVSVHKIVGWAKR